MSVAEEIWTSEDRKAAIVLLSKVVCAEIDRWLTKFPPDRTRSALLIALRLTQEQNGGWLTVELMDAVAAYLDLPKIAVYEVATFYNMYNLKPMGRHKIAICNNISCALSGAEKIIEHFQFHLGVQLGETTQDGEFTLCEAECLAACASAPVLQVDDKQYYENVIPEQVKTIIEQIKRGETSEENDHAE